LIDNREVSHSPKCVMQCTRNVLALQVVAGMLYTRNECISCCDGSCMQCVLKPCCLLWAARCAAQ
jgi:hypothetical protein